jgi:hypothetical protein
MTSEQKTLRTSGLVGGFIIALAVLVFLAAPTSALVKIVSDGFPLLLSICGALFSYALLRRQVKTRLGSRIWGAMTLGLILWAIGESIWTYYELVLRQETPFPSLADLMWAIGYIPLIYAVAAQYLPLNATVDRQRRMLILAVVVAMLALTVWLVIIPILTDPEAGTPVEVFFSLAYPVGDIVLLSFGVALAAAFLGGELALAWGPIAAGIILLSIADLLFSYGSWNGLYYPDGELNFLSGLFDTLYISAYVVWTIGLYLRLRLPGTGSDLDSRSILPEGKGIFLDADLLERIVQNAQDQERDQRASGGEDPLRVYVDAVLGLLDNLVSHAGGAGVETAFCAVLNEKARQKNCDFEIRKGCMVWKGAPPDSGCYQELLEEAIRYSKTVVATKTIDLKLQELEQHMPSRIVQAAEENRLRMVRWLEEKHG